MKAPIKLYNDDNNTLCVETFYHIIVKPGEDVWSFPMHQHDDFLEILLIVAGKAFFECERVKYTDQNWIFEPNKGQEKTVSPRICKV